MKRRPHESGERTRADLLRIIREQRGLHKSGLKRLAGRGWGNIGHHITVLEDNQLIDLEVHGRLLWVFDRHVARRERDILVASRPGPARRILEVLGVRHKASIRALSDELALSKKVIRVHLSTLTRARAVEKLDGHPPEFAPLQRNK